MNIFISANTEETSETTTRPQLESLIQWRRMQIKALHALRSHLADLKGDKQNNELCETMAAARAFVILPNPNNEDKTKPCQTSWNIRLWDATQTVVDLRFLSEEEQSWFAQILHLVENVVERNPASHSEMAHAPFVMPAKKIDAMKLKIRDRIDNFNQCNRADLESLRILYLR